MITKTIPTLTVLWMELLDYEQGGDHYELMIKGAK